MNNLFVDNNFELNYTTCGTQELTPMSFLRPFEIVDKPRFIVNKLEPGDIDQGCLGNCWFLSALSAVSRFPALVKNMIPPSQSFDKTKYTGKFVFKFCVYGEWKEIEIDDRLPVFANTKKRIYSSNTQEPCEFWVSLFEKAYAKLHGSYKSLDGGIPTVALYDLTGGLIETVNLHILSYKKIREILISCIKNNSIVNSAIYSKEYSGESIESNGLVAGHAYSILKLIDIKPKNLTNEIKTLICVRNPWGVETNEWNGEWSDNSKEWNYVSDDAKNSCKLFSKDSGSYWMDLNEFIKNYDSIFICHVTSKGIMEDCDFNLYTKHFDLPSPTVYFKLFNDNAKIVFSVTRKNYDVLCDNPIKMTIYKLKDPSLLFSPTNAIYVGSTGLFLSDFQISKRYKLRKGIYVVIPEILDPTNSESWVIQIYSSSVGELY